MPDWQVELGRGQDALTRSVAFPVPTLQRMLAELVNENTSC